ncbi:MAG: hypothetical protein PHO10_06770 [Gemmiger sp.]|nr:hypothetical protein [Gemmiger sp.]
MFTYLAVCIGITAALTVAQIVLARLPRPWVGFVLPVLAWAAVARPVYLALAPNAVRQMPDYYLAASLLFIGLWLLLIYFALFYYWKYKAASARSAGR